MQVDDLPGKRLKEPRLQHAHEAGQHHQVGRRGPDRGDEPNLARALQLRLERRGIHERGRHAEARPEREDARHRRVGQDPHHSRRAQPPGRLRREDRLRVAAPA